MGNSNSSADVDVWNKYGTSREYSDPYTVKSLIGGGHSKDARDASLSSAFVEKREVNDSTISQYQDFEIDADDFIVKKPVGYTIQSKNPQLLQKWEGVILKIDPDLGEFRALLIDKTCAESPDEEVTLNFDEVSESDFGLLREGAVFYWSIGYTYKGATKSKESALHFSRLKGFSKNSIKESKEYGLYLEELINGDNK